MVDPLTFATTFPATMNANVNRSLDNLGTKVASAAAGGAPVRTGALRGNFTAARHGHTVDISSRYYGIYVNSRNHLHPATVGFLDRAAQDTIDRPASWVVTS